MTVNNAFIIHTSLAERPPAALTRAMFIRVLATIIGVDLKPWLLDVHFNEDDCRVENKTVQQNLNIVCKTALNSIKQHKTLQKHRRQ